MVEIERKFLVTRWPERVKFLSDKVYAIKQAYLPSGKGLTVRVRTRESLRDKTRPTGLQEAFLTIKGPASGISREEFEYPIPYDDAIQMMRLKDRPAIEKIRHEIRHGNHVWEVDQFSGDNAGLIVAEIELESEDEEFTKPDWLGEEVTHDPRYNNARLAKAPFITWASNVGECP